MGGKKKEKGTPQKTPVVHSGRTKQKQCKVLRIFDDVGRSKLGLALKQK